MENMTIVERAERLVLVDNSLGNIKGDLEIVVGQLRLLGSDSQVLDCEASIGKDLAYLHNEWVGLMSKFVGDVVRDSKQEKS